MNRSKALCACQLNPRRSGQADTYQSDVLLEREASNCKDFTNFYDDVTDKEQLKLSAQILEVGSPAISISN